MMYVVLTALLDSGASINLINSNVVRKHEWNLEKDCEKLRGFNGSLECTQFSTVLTMSFGDRSVTTKAYVSSSISYDVIVGMPTLRKLGFSLVHKNSSIKPICTLQEPGDTVLDKDNIQKMFPPANKGVSYKKYAIPFRLKDNAETVCLKPYRLSRERYIWAQDRIQELIDKNVIRPSTSKFASPCVIVPKANGTLRLCQDYRALNSQTDLDPFPFPSIDEIISNFGGCKAFSKIDLKDGFHQVPLTKETRQYTAFVLPFGHYEFNYLPFGWKNSPSVFQRFMSNVLGNLLRDPFIKVYVDDILIGGRTKDECKM